MSSGYKRLLVVIPTRNRAHLAMGAIQSVLSQDVENVNVLVSDNSTIKEEVEVLSRFCREIGDERLDYVSPPERLPMSQHWNWALQQALERDATHFTMLTDRLLFRPSDLKTVVDIVRQRPDKIVSYKADLVVDHKTPVTLLINRWTGKLLEVKSSRLLFLTSIAEIHDSLPKIHDCIIPRRVIESVDDRFGSVCSSIAPDLNFCYRALAIEDSILFYDKSVLVNRARHRSISQSQTRGLISQEYADFLVGLGQMPLNFAAPIPEPRTILNYIIHEYCFVKKESMSPKFPEIDMDRYMRFIGSELEQFEDEKSKSEGEEALARHGWSRKQKDSIFKKLVTPVMWKHWLKLILTGPQTKKFWLLLSSSLGIHPPSRNLFEFKTSDEALAFVLRYPCRYTVSLREQELLLSGVTLSDHVGSVT